MTENRFKAPNFNSAYANISYFEPSLWDLKILFGETQLSAQNPEAGSVELKASISMGYPAAKALALYLMLNVQAYEAECGIVKIPASVLQADINHLAGAPIADLIAECSRIQATKLLEAQPPASGLKQ